MSDISFPNIPEAKTIVTSRGKESAALWEILYGTLDPKMPAWGLPVPEDAILGFSCRLIWSGGYLAPLEFVGDRSEFKEVSGKVDYSDLQDFFAPIAENFRELMSDLRLGWDSDVYILVEQDNYKALLTCNGSCGYVYASFWEKAPALETEVKKKMLKVLDEWDHTLSDEDVKGLSEDLTTEVCKLIKLYK